jgi:DNA-binding XRE family transcriptional regulator
MSSDNDSLSLHNRLAVFRAERGLSRAALADLVSVNPQTIGFLERGQYGPSLELGLKLAAVFGVPVETLFSLEPFTPLATSLAAQRTLEGEQ